MRYDLLVFLHHRLRWLSNCIEVSERLLFLCCALGGSQTLLFTLLLVKILAHFKDIPKWLHYKSFHTLICSYADNLGFKITTSWLKVVYLWREWFVPHPLPDLVHSRNGYPANSCSLKDLFTPQNACIMVHDVKFNVPRPIIIVLDWRDWKGSEIFSVKPAYESREEIAKPLTGHKCANWTSTSATSTPT